MSLTVTRAKVKEKCGVDVSDYDTPIDNLISDWTPAIEFAIKNEHIADTGNTGLQATLNLGAAELVSGEFLAQQGRRSGAIDVLHFGEIEVRPAGSVDWDDPFGLKRQGWERLRPYLKTDPKLPARADIRTGSKPEVLQ